MRKALIKEFILQVIGAAGIAGCGAGVCAVVHSFFRLIGGEGIEEVVKDLKLFLLILWVTGFFFLFLHTLLSYLWI